MKSQILFQDDAYLWIECACCRKLVGLWDSELGDRDFVCAECEELIIDDEDEEK